MSFNKDRCKVSGTWVVPNGQAQTFVADVAGVLRVSLGRAWVTLDRSRQGFVSVARPAMADDDLFLDATANLPLGAGQAIVLESLSTESASNLTLVWEATVPVSSSQRWQQTVAQPAHELSQGMMQVVLALGKIVQGLVGYTLLWVITE